MGKSCGASEPSNGGCAESDNLLATRLRFSVPQILENL
jgi:hypothetical protein